MTRHRETSAGLTDRHRQPNAYRDAKGERYGQDRRRRRASVTGRHTSAVLEDSRRVPMPQEIRTIEEMLELQGLPRDFFGHSPLTKEAMRRLVGNAVPLPMAEALGFAVRSALESTGIVGQPAS